MGYEIGMFGGIGFSDKYLVHNDKNVVELDTDFKNPEYFLMIYGAENPIAYEIFYHLKKTNEIYKDYMYWYENMWHFLENINIKHFSLTLLDDIKLIKFINEDGYLFIIDGHLNKKIRVGKILDEEIIELLSGSMEQLIIPLIELYWNNGGKIMSECFN